MSDSKKRQHCDPSDGVSASQKKSRVDGQDQTAVTDSEVDEFFAILRRMRVAVDYFKRGNAEGRKLTETGELERQSNGNESNGSKGNGTREQAVGVTVKENSALDLNASPEQEDDRA